MIDKSTQTEESETKNQTTQTEHEFQMLGIENESKFQQVTRKWKKNK